MCQIQPSASWIIFNFDSSCSLFKVIVDNLKSTFFVGHPVCACLAKLCKINNEPIGYFYLSPGITSSLALDPVHNQCDQSGIITFARCVTVRFALQPIAFLASAIV